MIIYELEGVSSRPVNIPTYLLGEAAAHLMDI